MIAKFYALFYITFIIVRVLNIIVFKDNNSNSTANLNFLIS